MVASKLTLDEVEEIEKSVAEQVEQVYQYCITH
jgi:hypothetical protein